LNTDFAPSPDTLQVPFDAGKAYQIHLPQFDGPFDLLLFFIERDELEVHDIPISKITQEFLAYLNQLSSHRIEIASEFIVTAAQLMKIKARMLLPRPQLDEKGQPVDPRTELVNRLLEYKRYKQASAELEVLQQTRELSFARGFIAGEENLLKELSTPEENLYGLTLYRLQRVYHMALLRQKYTNLKPSHVIQQYPYTMEDVRKQMEAALPIGQRVEFGELLLKEPTRLYAIFTFLVLLEMAAGRALHFIRGDGYNQFWVVRQEAEEVALLNEN
jgi:segregation and condensation protein A